MALKDLLGRLPPRSLAMLVIGAFIAGGFVAVFIIPEFREAGQLRPRIAELKADIDIQRQLVPVRAALAKAEAALPPAAADVKSEPLPLADVGRLTEIVDGLAVPAGLRVASVAPDAASVGKSGLLAVRLRLLGPVGAMREFLLALGRFAPLVKIETATTMVGHDGRELTLKCWLAVR